MHQEIVIQKKVKLGQIVVWVIISIICIVYCVALIKLGIFEILDSGSHNRGHREVSGIVTAFVICPPIFSLILLQFTLADYFRKIWGDKTSLFFDERRLFFLSRIKTVNLQEIVSLKDYELVNGKPKKQVYVRSYKFFFTAEQGREIDVEMRFWTKLQREKVLTHIKSLQPSISIDIKRTT